LIDTGSKGKIEYQNTKHTVVNEKYQKDLLVTNPANLWLVYIHRQTGKIIVSSDCAMWMMCINLYQFAGFVTYNSVWCCKF